MRCFIIALFIPAFFAVTGCKKNNPSPGSGPGTADVLRPATMKFYEGTIGTLAPVWTYEYNNDNELIKFGEEGKEIRHVEHAKVQRKLYSRDFESTTNYVYLVLGTFDCSIYDPAHQPDVVSVQTTTRNLVNNQDIKPPVIEWNFGFTPDYQVAIDKTASGLGIQANYTYDDNRNLKKMEFMSLSGSLSLLVYLRMTVTGYDDKLSPFSAVKGYRWASFPQNSNEQYAHALSKNNPIQMKTEYWSTTTNSYYTGETADFNYTYNDQGYPTKIIITTTFTPEMTPAFKNVKIYEFTYR